jgi:SAM-dependent methyltransferase
MHQNPSASDWAGARGDKWSAQAPAMEATLEPVDEPLIAALRLDAPLRIAEIGCGGGRTATAILRRAPEGSVVHGYDISPRLVELARGRAHRDDGALEFHVADMASAAPPAPYDRLVSRFGIMFFDDPQAAFGNLARWLARGGRFAFAAWARPDDNPWMTATRDAVAQVVNVPQPDPEAPGAFRYADVGKLLALLDEAGFHALETHDWRGTLPLGGGRGPADAASFAIASFSSFAELLDKAGPDALRQARGALTTRLSRHLRDGLVHMPARVHIVTGARR